jgi:hypothetical protein
MMPMNLVGVMLVENLFISRDPSNQAASDTLCFHHCFVYILVPTLNLEFPIYPKPILRMFKLQASLPAFFTTQFCSRDMLLVFLAETPPRTNTRQARREGSGMGATNTQTTPYTKENKHRQTTNSDGQTHHDSIGGCCRPVFVRYLTYRAGD